MPFKWRLLRANLSPYTTLAQASMRVTGLTCSLGGTADQLEEVATGASGLQNLGNGNYQINWKAPKEYAARARCCISTSGRASPGRVLQVREVAI